MAKLDQFDRAPFEPIYSQDGLNQTIELGGIPVKIEHRGEVCDDDCKVSLEFLPDAHLKIVSSAKDRSLAHSLGFLADDDATYRITLRESGTSFDAICTGPCEESSGFTFFPKTMDVMVYGATDNISTLTFHLLNFPDFIGPDDYALMKGETNNRGFRRCGRVTLGGDGWKITIIADGKTAEREKLLNSKGGYILTHVGQITREDNAEFSSDAATDILSCLYYFLSFTLGRWVDPLLPVGCDVDGNRVFEHWSVRTSTAGCWDGFSTWFDKLHGELLSQVFPGFIDLWLDETWRSMLPKVLYWYIGACARGVGIGVDVGIILAQTALELLAWNYCIVDRKMVSKAAFKRNGLVTSDKLRLLASVLDIPCELSPTIAKLQPASGKRWDDSMDAITAIRNGLVHPDAQTQQTSRGYFEGWKLSLWLIDLVLLRLCKHTGGYGNRLTTRWVGAIEAVPWA